MSDNKNNNNIGFKGLLKFFNIGIKKSKNGEIKKLIPTEKVIDKDGNEKIKAIYFPSELQKYYRDWMENCHDNPTTLRHRLDRYNDLDYMFYNDSMCGKAIKLYADEASQADNANQIITVNAKLKKVSDYIYNFFDKIGITQDVIKEVAFNLALYGDSFFINTVEEDNGITSIVPIDVRSVDDRIEFNAINAKAQLEKFRYSFSLLNRDIRLKKLADTLLDKTDKSKYYKNYLFGFQIEKDITVPPWAITHFRMFSSKTEFAPFGRPILINAISLFRQLKASKNLMAMCRAAKLPKELFEVAVDENMTRIEKWNAVNSAREEYKNLAAEEGNYETFSVGGEIWTAQGLIDYKLIDNKIDLNDIADIELLRDDLIAATDIPKNYLISEGGGWVSGIALLAQSKPFARTVFSIQSAIIKELIQLVKMQFIITGDFPIDTEFEILMNFPTVEDSKDRISNKNDTLALAKNIIDTLSSTIGLSSDQMPIEIVKDIFSRYSFLSPDDIKLWIDDMQKNKEEQKINLEPNILPDETIETEEEIKEKVNKKLKRINENLILECYFDAKKRMHFFEGLHSGKHFVSSYNNDHIHNQVLDLLKQGKDNKLQENIEKNSLEKHKVEKIKKKNPIKREGWI